MQNLENNFPSVKTIASSSVIEEWTMEEATVLIHAAEVARSKELARLARNTFKMIANLFAGHSPRAVAPVSNESDCGAVNTVNNGLLGDVIIPDAINGNNKNHHLAA